jgi:N-acetylglucosaminyl-diphospho-decaprenol L-rhamnosyltransferase
MTVHALIPVFNRLDMTRRVVADLRAQRDVDLRIVVIDDGSTDGTADWLAAQHDILTIRGDGNLWWAGAVDAALRQVVPRASDGDYVLFLNNDTIVEPDLVSTLVRVSREHHGAAVGTALRDQASPHELISIGPRMNAWHMHVWDLIDELSPEECRAPRAVYEVDALSGRGTLYPLAVLRATGFLHPKLLPHYHADYELAARARRKGFRTLVSTEAVVYTERSFGVKREAAKGWSERFRKGAPNNPLHQVAFRLLVGTGLQRATALPRMALEQSKQVALRITPRHVQFVLRFGWALARSPFSGQARARVLLYLEQRIGRGSASAWHAYRAGTFVDVHGKSVLVVGCSLGVDCAAFVRLGARVVHGLDVIEKVGTGYRHARVAYMRASARAIPVRSDSYELVCCLATAEEMPDLEQALAEMARVTHEGGFIYTVAAGVLSKRRGRARIHRQEADLRDSCAY